MCDNCGNDGYDPTEDALIMSLAKNMPMLHPEALNAIFQTCVAEMFVRSEPDQWETNWRELTSVVKIMFDPETTPEPEVLQSFIDARADLQAGWKEEQAEEEAAATFVEGSNDLDQLLSEHGVLDDEEVYGNYL